MQKRWFATVAGVAVLLGLVLSAFVSNTGTVRAASSTTVTLGATITGTATFAAGTTAGHTTVTINLTGLPASSSHAAHIHMGNSCTANGPVVYPLTDVVADATGKGTSTTDLAVAATSFADGNHYVNVHDFSSTGGVGRGISCGVIGNAATSTNLSSATGTAVITDNGNGTTNVKVTVMGLEPNTKHAEHIHVGASCASNGAVVYPLPDLTADAMGMASSTMDVQAAYSAIADANHYVNVHVRGSTETPAVGYGITCGEVAAAAAPGTTVPATTAAPATTAPAATAAPTETTSMPGLPNTGRATGVAEASQSALPLLFLAVALVLVFGLGGALVLRARSARH